MQHDLKIWPPYFDDVADGKKLFEIRKADRPYAVGDTLLLREYEPGPDKYTGRKLSKRVTCMISGDDPMGYAFGLRTGFVALGLSN